MDAPPEPTQKVSRAPKAVLGAVVLLLAFEFFVARADWFWGWISFSQIGVIDALEEEVLPESQPLIVFAGSSRVRDAIAPRVIEEELGLPEHSVLNVGLTMGTAFDTSILYRRNRKTFEGTKIVFFGVEPFQFDRRTVPTERILRYGTLRDRIDFLPKRDRLHHIAGFFWRTLDSGPPLRRLATSAVKGRPKEIPITADGRIAWRTKRDNRAAHKRPVTTDVDRYFARWKYSKNRERQLTSLIKTLSDDGFTVVLFQVPARDEYWEVAEERYPRRVARYKKHLDELSEGRPTQLFWGASEAGLRDRNFHDYGHLKNKAARRFSRRLAKTIGKDYPELLAEIGGSAPKGRKRGSSKKTDR